MSINRRMKKAFLDTKIEIKNPSGAKSYKWDTNNSKSIEIALYDLDDRVLTDTAKYIDSTHVGLTREKNVKKDINRIRIHEDTYLVSSCKPNGRLTQLILKEVSNVK